MFGVVWIPFGLGWLIYIYICVLLFEILGATEVCLLSWNEKKCDCLSNVLLFISY